MTEVFSSGGGTQSACISALIVKGRLPKPDYAVIADTEREHPAVWVYHNTVIEPQLASVGVKIHRVPKSKYATVDLFSKKDNSVLMPMFSNQTSEVTKLPTYCSNEWKQRVINRFMREQGVPTSEQRRWIGFSLDEATRYTRMALSADGIAGRVRFPLIQDVPMRRQQAIAFVESIGWPTPPRSACWMCPHHGDKEWIDLKDNYPAEFQMAVELEKELQSRDRFVFLHRACVPLDQVVFSDNGEGTQCNLGLCFV